MARNIEDIAKDKPRLTRQEFCNECEVEGEKLNYRTLQRDLRNGDVEEDADKKIDITVKKNRDYFNERVKHVENKRAKIGRNLDIEKKELEVAKISEEVEIKKLQRAKMEAELVPTDLVYLTLNSHYKFIRQQFYYAAEQIATDAVRKMGGSKKDITEVKESIIKICNDLVNKSNKQSADEIKTIIDEFAALYGR